MVGSPLPPPPRNAESFTQDSSFLSLRSDQQCEEQEEDISTAPSESPDIVHYAHDELVALRVDTDDERVVHDVEIR